VELLLTAALLFAVCWLIGVKMDKTPKDREKRLGEDLRGPLGEA